jgi:hypothetical protein
MEQERKARAARAIINLSALAGHVHFTKCVDPDGPVVRWDALEDWRWSSGETVLIEVLRVILLGHGHATIADLYRLDEQNRAVVVMALTYLFGHQTGEGWA